MMKRLMTTVMLSLFIFLSAPFALADWGHDPYQSEAVMDYPGQAWLCVVPDGSGHSLTEAQDEFGGSVDATITLALRDYNNDPITNFPWEDLWLESADDGLVFCPLGTAADANTDVNGMTQWTQSLRGGGASEANCFVLINGSPLPGPGLPLHFTSPDLNRDLQVNLSDLSYFATDYFGGYNPRSDFYHDGVLNLSDFARFAQSFQAQCP